MPGDYMPHDKGGYRAWLVNISDRLPTDGVTIGVTSGNITATTTVCNNQIAREDDLVAKKSAYDAALATTTSGRTSTSAFLRSAIGDWKRLPGYTPALGADLQIVGSADTFDPATYKPEFKAKVTGGAIRLDWTKKGVDAVHIYSRLRGQPGWTLIGMDTSSPYIDGRPLASATVPETREYMLRGVVTDAEIGVNSDIVSVTWDGS